MVIKLTAGEAREVRVLLQWLYNDAGAEMGIPSWNLKDVGNWNAVSRNAKRVSKLLGMEMGE